MPPIENLARANFHAAKEKTPDAPSSPLQKKTRALGVMAFAVLVAAGPVLAQIPTLPKPGTDTKFLAPLVGMKKKAGKKMPPMMPPVDSAGTMTCAWTKDALFLACDIDEKISGGPIDRFTGHVVLGWDFSLKRYRAFLSSNQGATVLFTGKRQLNTLVLESEPVQTPIGPTKITWTFDLNDEKAIGFKDERSIGGAPAFVFEETTLR